VMRKKSNGATQSDERHQACTNFTIKRQSSKSGVSSYSANLMCPCHSRDALIRQHSLAWIHRPFIYTWFQQKITMS